LIPQPAVRLACSLALGVSVLSGCHTYRVVDTAPTGAAVRVSVPVQSALAGPNAAPRTEAIEGRILQNGDTLALATETRRTLGAYRDIVQLDTLRLSRDQVATLEVRELSTTRSVVLGVVLTAGVTALGVLAYNAATGSSGNDGGGGDPPAFAISASVIGRLWSLVPR